MNERGGDGWWLTAEDHHFALIALQLRIRREILKAVGSGLNRLEDIEDAVGLSPEQLRFHIEILEKASLVIHRPQGCVLTEVGRAYLKKMARD